MMNSLEVRAPFLDPNDLWNLPLAKCQPRGSATVTRPVELNVDWHDAGCQVPSISIESRVSQCRLVTGFEILARLICDCVWKVSRTSSTRASWTSKYGAT